MTDTLNERKEKIQSVATQYETIAQELKLMQEKLAVAKSNFDSIPSVAGAEKIKILDIVSEQFKNTVTKDNKLIVQYELITGKLT